LTIWEDAIELGLLERYFGENGTEVRVTAAGRAILQ